jgi:rare lipoprotein A (peptidoglycan hydrolase)
MLVMRTRDLFETRGRKLRACLVLSGIVMCALIGPSAAVMHDGEDNSAGLSTVAAGNLTVEGDIVGSVKRHRAHKASLRHRAKAKKAKKTVRIWKDKEHALDGVASFYVDDTATASGEKFDNNAMAAAHRTLPFGTRLRVTDLKTGNAITVRINDRGPYIEGRCIDLTSAAADALGITKTRGIANVKLEVVERSAELGVNKPVDAYAKVDVVEQSVEHGAAPKPVVE